MVKILDFWQNYFLFSVFLILFFLIFLFDSSLIGFVIGAPGTLSASIIVDGDWGNPSFNMTRYYSPLPVFFEGWNSTPRGEIVEWAWDFESDGTEDFIGFNAGHIYNNSGNYTATLRVMNYVGTNATATIGIEVLERNGSIYYVDSVIGNDSCDGLNSIVFNETQCPWKTASKAFVKVNTTNYIPGDQILFNRGQTFDFNETVNAPRGQGILFADYGSGDKPIIKAGNFNGRWFDKSVGSTAFEDITFKNLVFNGANSSGGSTGAFIFINPAEGNIKSLLLESVDFQNASSFFVFNADPHLNKTADNVYFSNSQFFNSSAGIMFFGEMKNFILINNTFDYAPENHIAYIAYMDAGIIADNVFSRSAFGRASLRVDSDVTSSPLPSPAITSVYHTENVHILRNKLLGWVDPIDTGTSPHNGNGRRYNQALVELEPNKRSNQTFGDIIFEENILTNFEIGLAIGANENLTIRNNLFVSPTNSTSNKVITICSNFCDKPVKNVRIIGNTFVMQGNKETSAPIPFIDVYNFSGTIYPEFNNLRNHENITLLNNIFMVVSGGGSLMDIMANDSALIKNITTDYNIYNFSTTNLVYTPYSTEIYNLSTWNIRTTNDANSVLGNPGFVNTISLYAHTPGEPVSLIDSLLEVTNYTSMFVLAGNSQAINRGTNLTVDSFYDYNHAVRVWGTDIGVFENISGVPASTSSVSLSPETTTASSGGGGTCTVLWNCSLWNNMDEECGTRICLRANTCNINPIKPIENLDCSLLKTSESFCGDSICNGDETNDSCSFDCSSDLKFRNEILKKLIDFVKGNTIKFISSVLIFILSLVLGVLIIRLIRVKLKLRH